jgi:hypothetical protein
MEVQGAAVAPSVAQEIMLGVPVLLDLPYKATMVVLVELTVLHIVTVEAVAALVQLETMRAHNSIIVAVETEFSLALQELLRSTLVAVEVAAQEPAARAVEEMAAVPWEVLEQQTLVEVVVAPVVQEV